MSEPKVSVIVPVYNVEDYLAECLDSLIAQTLAEIEIVCVNDGSTDSSSQILNEYARKDARIKVVNRKNGGLSAARNSGIAASSAGIICFLDSDDTFMPDACQTIFDSMSESGADALVFGANCIPNDGGNSWLSAHLSPCDVVYDEFCGDILFREMSRPFVWRCAFAREFLNSNNLAFDESVKFGEDQIFQCIAYPLAHKIQFISDKLYNYKVSRSGSLMANYAGDDLVKGREHAIILRKIFEDWTARGFFKERKAWALALVLELGVGMFENADIEIQEEINKCLRREVGKYFFRSSILKSGQTQCDKERLIHALYPEAMPSQDARIAGAHFENGKVYFHVISAEPHPIFRVFLTSNFDGHPQPSNVYPARIFNSEKGEVSRDFILEIPESDLSKTSISLMDNDEIIFEVKNTRKIALREKVKNRLLHNPYSYLAYWEEQCTSTNYQIKVLSRIPKGDKAIWRCEINWEGAAAGPSVEVYDLEGNRLKFACYDFETQLLCEESSRRRRIVSVELDASANHFMVVAKPNKEDSLQEGFCVIDDFLASMFASRHSWETSNAGSDSKRYEEWLASKLPEWEHFSIGDDGEEDVATLIYGESSSFETSQALNSDYVLLKREDDELEPFAIKNLLHVLKTNVKASIAYCDDDELCEGGGHENPVFRAALDVDGLYSENAVGSTILVKASSIDWAALRTCDLAYEVALQGVSKGLGFVHVPHVLCHRCNSLAASKEALQNHLNEMGIFATVEKQVDGHLRVSYALPSSPLRASIIIPNKDHLDVLRPCLDSILEKSTYKNFEIVIVENNSVEAETFEYYDNIESAHENVKVYNFEGEFNYPKIINFGVANSSGEVLIFLNNDTEVISPNWIEEMMDPLQRQDVGVVGAKLYYRDGLVQHCGMMINGNFDLAHVNQDFDSREGGYLDKALYPHDYSGVTGACQMVTRENFELVGGYSEEFKVGFNDMDFCLKLYKEGKRSICWPRAELHHYEFTSRGREIEGSSEMQRLCEEHDLFVAKWKEFLGGHDPYLNENLNQFNIYYSL